jgi:hypothetical protein
MKELIENHLNSNELTIKTELCKLYDKYGSDKSTWHNYSQLYKKLFERFSDKEINYLEVGLGTNNTDVPSNMGVNGSPGASLYAASDFYNKWNIVGLDVDTRVLFQSPEKRISTFFVNQLESDTIQDLWKNEFSDTKFDIIIDDGLHEFVANKIFFENAFEKLSEDGIYIVEDILNAEMPLFKEYFDTVDCDYYLFNLPYSKNNKDNNLIVVTHKKQDVKWYAPLKQEDVWVYSTN